MHANRCTTLPGGWGAPHHLGFQKGFKPTIILIQSSSVLSCLDTKSRSCSKSHRATILCTLGPAAAAAEAWLHAQLRAGDGVSAYGVRTDSAPHDGEPPASRADADASSLEPPLQSVRVAWERPCEAVPETTKVLHRRSAAAARVPLRHLTSAVTSTPRQTDATTTHVSPPRPPLQAWA